MNRRSPLVEFCMVLAVCALLVAPAIGVLAADETKGTSETDEQWQTTRDRLMLGYALVWLLTAGYLVASHRRNSRLREDIDFLKRRVDEL